MFGHLNETGWFTEPRGLTLASGVGLGGAAVSRVTLQQEDFGCEPAADLEAFWDDGLFVPSCVQRNAHDLYL